MWGRTIINVLKQIRLSCPRMRRKCDILHHTAKLEKQNIVCFSLTCDHEFLLWATDYYLLLLLLELLFIIKNIRISCHDVKRRRK